MHSFPTKYKPHVYAGLATVSIMILAGTVVALTVLTPVFVVLSPVLVPAAITLGILATGFLASGGLGISAIVILVWLYKTWPEKADKQERSDKVLVRDKLIEEEKTPRGDKPTEEENTPEGDKLVTVNEKKMSEGDKLVEENKSPVGDKPLEEETLIHEISKVLLEEQNSISPKCCGPTPSTSTKRSLQIRVAMDPTKVRSSFIKDYQKAPRVGALAYHYFTTRDKIT